MSDNPINDKPCVNECIRKGTETLDQPQLMGALHGHFCDREYFAIKLALERAAELVEHVTSMITSTSGGSDNVQATKDAPLPFNVQAFNDANETYGRLVYWARHWAQVLRRQPPGAAVRAWSNSAGVVIGLAADTTPAAARYAVSTMAIWLNAHLEDILWQTPTDDVVFFHDELGDIFRVAARWPFEMQARPGIIPCPHDGSKIIVYPPSDLGETMRIVCDEGHVYDEDKFEFYVREFAEQQKEIKKSEKVQARLAKRYAA
jgi:hypothetical protein